MVSYSCADLVCERFSFADPFIVYLHEDDGIEPVAVPTDGDGRVTAPE